MDENAAEFEPVSKQNRNALLAFVSDITFYVTFIAIIMDSNDFTKRLKRVPLYIKQIVKLISLTLDRFSLN